jgi:FtsZ-interacting cell division protein YlmF
MGFMDKMKDLVGIVDDYDDDEYEVSQEEVDEYKREMSAAAEPAAPLPPSGGFSPRSFGNVEPPQRFASAAPVQNAEPLADSRASRNDSAAFRMVVIEPKSIDECRKLIDNLRANKPVIINLEKVETDLARKMFDFLSGATYALSGTIQRINQNIYLFAPRNVNIRALVDRATEAGKPTNTSPW